VSKILALQRIGIIGGSGLGEALRSVGEGETRSVETPFGKTSAPITLTDVSGIPVALLARHGPGHLLNPTRVPYRANIYALKSLGVTHILASAAAGSLREDIHPREIVIADQVIDKTFLRASTFFDELAVHVEFASPFCPTLRGVLLEAAGKLRTKVHPRGTYVCMEGPQLSSQAESDLHRQWGADLIGMTALPEAKLAREAEICYALLALPTDYDCWKPPPAELSGMKLLREIASNLSAVTSQALELIRESLKIIASGAIETSCHCQEALALGIWSDRSRIPGHVTQRLSLLLSKYIETPKAV
jgi:5'-methylthioadenosine phosphorylase